MNIINVRFPEANRVVRLTPRVDAWRRCGLIIACCVFAYLAIQFARLFGWLP